MNHATATMHLRAMMVGAQKARSISLEGLGPDTTPTAADTAFLASLSPWLFGAKGCLPTLVRAVTDAEAGKPISGLDFNNLLIIATRLEPSIAVCALNYQQDPLPDPDIRWMAETWERPA